MWPGDEDGVHAGVRVDGELRAVGSMVREGDGWRIRGMATDPDWRGRGLGGLVLERLLTAAGGEPVWCQARPRAVSLYERFGFERDGPPFDVPGLGPHQLMRLRR